VVEIDWRLLAALFGTALLVVLVLARKWGEWRRSVRAKRRGARAVRGEEAAEALLQNAGYEILERQLGLTWEIECDGEPVEFLLRADLLVHRDGQDYIAEVKTGELAPSLTNASTRRQMLEYSIAFDSPVILLVDVERGQILEVYFPQPNESSQLNKSSSYNEELDAELDPTAEAEREVDAGAPR
tara:strand:- start:7441 stop:7995 length:555 start_codon:yes stop_codon:yes gene_type:complete